MSDRIPTAKRDRSLRHCCDRNSPTLPHLQKFLGEIISYFSLQLTTPCWLLLKSPNLALLVILIDIAASPCFESFCLEYDLVDRSLDC